MMENSKKFETDFFGISQTTSGLEKAIDKYFYCLYDAITSNKVRSLDLIYVTTYFS